MMLATEMTNVPKPRLKPCPPCKAIFAVSCEKIVPLVQQRSSVQGNCSAKSLAGNIVDSSLSSLSSTSHTNTNPQIYRGGGSGQGEREGEGTFLPPCHVLNYHMVLRPKGTSHNQGSHSGLIHRTLINTNAHKIQH